MLNTLHRLYYTTWGGIHKNRHLPYMLHGFSMLALPHWWTERQREDLLRQFEETTSDKEYDTRKSFKERVKELFQ